MIDETRLKSKASKYPNQKWIDSNDGISIFVVATKNDISITVWDADKRPIEFKSYKETKSIEKKF